MGRWLPLVSLVPTLYRHRVQTQLLHLELGVTATWRHFELAPAVPCEGGLRVLCALRSCCAQPSVCSGCPIPSAHSLSTP